jgi:3-oxoacyl-[acyl-carrier protein] reductase
MSGKKVALITGAAKRLGKEIAIWLADNDFNIVINYLNSDRQAKDLVKYINNSGGSAISIQSDISKGSGVSDLFKDAFKKFGRIDVLINNAAIFKKFETEKLKEKDWDQTIDTNLKSCFLCSMEAIKYMKKQEGGKIINISSLGGIKPYKGYLPYCVSKAGVIMLTKSLAKEFAPDILINSIAPGMIEFNEKLDKHKPDIDKIPLKRYASPKDIIDLIQYLVISSKYITGQTFIIDGGRILN